MGVRAIFQLAPPWSEAQIFDVGYEQAADVVVLTHLDSIPMRLTRYAHDNWTLAYANFVATVTPPAVYAGSAFTPNMGTGYTATPYSYVITSIDAATGQESLNTGGIALSNDLTMKGNYNEIEWTLVPGVERYNVYKFGAGTYGFIGTTEGDSFIDDNIAPDFSQSYPRPYDPFNGANNQPAVVAFWQQRAMYARTYNKPNGIWGSQSANLFNFNSSRPLNDADALAFAVSGRRVNAIMHLVPLKSLIVFTTDAVFSVKGNGDTGAITPTQIDITPEGYRAASRVRPVVVDDIAFFNTAKGGTIRTIGYQFEADGYKGNDLTVFAPHFFLNVTAVDMTWAEFPLSVLAVPMDDGDVRVLTWQAEQQVWGWSKWQTDGEVESVCTVSENGEDVIYAIVKRGDKRYVEYTASIRWTDVEDAIYLDSALTYSGDPKTTFGGLEHLEGRTIDVLADGAVYSGLVVLGGQIELTQPASKVVAGLPYESWIRTLPLGMEEEKGEPKTIAGATVKVLRSRGLEVGIGKDLPPGQLEPASSDDEIDGLIDEIKTRDLEPFGEPTRLFSGDLPVDVENGDWRAADVVVRQRHPLPMTVLGVTPDYLLSE
jgi:hypothetical protein